MTLVKHVLVPVDFSECSRAALRYALALAEAFDAKVTLLHVWEPPEFAGADLMVLAHSEGISVGDYGRRQAKQELDQLADTLERGEALERTIEIGRPRERILALADSGTYDLVVMGTHGRTGRARMFAGSVAEAVVRRATIPVLTVRAAEAAG